MFVAFQESVLSYLENLKIEVQQLSAKVGSLLAANQFDDEGESTFNFPISSDESLDTFENSLTDSVTRKKLVCILCTIYKFSLPWLKFKFKGG